MRYSEWLSLFTFFSRMRSKGSRFTLGVWGLRLCSPDVVQPSATVRNRPCEAHMAVPMASFAKGVTFGGFKCRVASFRVASVPLCDIQTCFAKCQKLFCVAGAIFFASFSEDELQFLWQARHFGGFHRHFAR